MILHGFFRSSASWRVRIALNLKGIEAQQVTHQLRKNEQNAPDYLAVNPQGLVPALVLDDGTVLTQSLAICEYLDEVQPDPPLLPKGAVARAKARAVADAIACEIHPVQNLKVLRRLREIGQDEEQVNAWAAKTIEDGFDAIDVLLKDSGGPFAFGDAPTLADICIVPQMNNARRFKVALRWPRLEAIEAACLQLDAFARSAPAHQPDAE